MDKIKRIFTCKNGHSYESKKPICSSYHDWALAQIGSKLRVANDRCKICGDPIMTEDDYVDGKVVMGAVRING